LRHSRLTKSTDSGEFACPAAQFASLIAPYEQGDVTAAHPDALCEKRLSIKALPTDRLSSSGPRRK
jgi:hypothetical protein